MQSGLDNILAVFSAPILARGARIQGTSQIGVVLYAKCSDRTPLNEVAGMRYGASMASASFGTQHLTFCAQAGMMLTCRFPGGLVDGPTAFNNVGLHGTSGDHHSFGDRPGR